MTKAETNKYKAAAYRAAKNAEGVNKDAKVNKLGYVEGGAAGYKALKNNDNAKGWGYAA